MHRPVTTASLRARRERNDRGAVALIMALSLTALLIASALVLDFGLVRVDRQVNKSSADAAVTAGLYGLNGGGGAAYPYRGVCDTLRYLQQNDPRFAAVTDTSGVWTNGNDVPTGNGCSVSTTWRDTVCVRGDKSSWAKFTWTGTWQDEPLQVIIQSGYQLAASGWSEESLSAVQADNNDGADGCHQLAVTIRQNRKPGLGSLAMSSDLVSAIRTVGRVEPGPGGYAPAMLLLKQEGCPVVETGSANGTSFIHVKGAVSSNGLSQPGTIHSDAGGGDCSGGSNESILLGRGTNGIVAYAAPLVANPSAPDPAKPGQITTVAGTNGFAPNSGVISDGIGLVYGNQNLYGSASPAAPVPPSGRPEVTRKVVDDRYLSGVRTALSNAWTGVFDNLTAANADDAGNDYHVVSCNNQGIVSAADMPTPALTEADKLFVDCRGTRQLKEMPTVNAGTIVFNGNVHPTGTVSLPYAEKVYIFGEDGDTNALNLGTGADKFIMHTNAGAPLGQSLLDATTGRCSSGRTADRATLFLRNGTLNQSNGTLQLCNTTVFMMGGQADGCLPNTSDLDYPEPDLSPCAGDAGTGYLDQSGGNIDWTAPNEHDVMTLANGDPDPSLAASWADPDGPEDLALWGETATDNGRQLRMTGGGVFHVKGVFMLPHAAPFVISGLATLNLVDAQYIVHEIELNGASTAIIMSVDPNAAITMPKLQLVGLVR